MWALTNQTRFKAERTFVRDAEGAEIWLVAVRATFAIGPNGEITLAKDQQEVCRIPEFFGNSAFSSLRYDSDLVRTKNGTDVILHARAHAPGGHAASFVDVSATVGALSKCLRVFGERSWIWTGSDYRPSPPQPFISLPIRYECAWGGLLPGGSARDPLNPAGIGLNPDVDRRVPNIESPLRPLQTFRSGAEIVGFGPIACHWQQRLRFAGTYDDEWQRNRRPLLPTDFQDSYFRCAPLDQQFNGFLHGGEQVVLQNLTPEGTLQFQLPRLSFGFSTQIANNITNHRGQLHTVIIEPEERRLIMVWHTALACHNTLYTMKGTTVFEKNNSAHSAALA